MWIISSKHICISKCNAHWLMQKLKEVHYSYDWTIHLEVAKKNP